MKSLVNISIDDASPRQDSDTTCLKFCNKLIELFPEIRFSLFIPVSYCRWRDDDADMNPYEFLITKYQEFIAEIKALPTKNYELCAHGVFHGEIVSKNNNNEFQSMNYDEAYKSLSYMFEVFQTADINVKKIFRPSAYRMSAEAIKAAKDIGITLLALSSDDYLQPVYLDEDKNFGNVVYYNCSPPVKPLAVFEKNEIVYHALHKDKNYIGHEKNFNELVSFLNENIDDTQFCFIEELL